MEVEHSKASGWVGWVLFGGIMLVLVGATHLSVGSLAVFRPEILAGTRPDVVLGLPLVVLAWGHLVLGAGAVVTGVALIRGLLWARIVAVVITVVNVLVSFVVATVFPVWAVLIVVLSGLVLYATVAHGAEVYDSYPR